MYENFYKLSKEKRKQILDGAMMEFSRYGFEKTSVQQIADAAGISKSMVFHYFGNKVQLYNFLVIYTCDYSLEKIDEFIEEIKALDYLEGYYLVAKTKLRLFNEENALMRFSGSILMSKEDVNLFKTAREKLDLLKEARGKYPAMMHGDKMGTKLRKDIPKEVSLKYIKWIMDGFTQELMVKIQMAGMADANFDKDWEDFDKLLEDLKKIFY
ncbi:MAG: TetR/AcrR family transcriptional regulator [Tissierellia bacterium]|nr:TetR/AcrR family transcriptional regulator [Tissierellia bacterium]